MLENAIIYYKLQGYDFPEGWYTWFHNVPEESCSVIEKNEVAAIDIHYDGKGKYHLELFTREELLRNQKLRLNKFLRNFQELLLALDISLMTLQTRKTPMW